MKYVCMSPSKCTNMYFSRNQIFAMAKIRRIGHDLQIPFFFLLLLLLLLDFKRDTRRKQAPTCTIHPGPPIFLHILDPL